MALLNPSGNNSVTSILLTLIVVLVVSPAMFGVGLWLIGALQPVLNLKVYAGLVLITLWFIFMKYLS